MLEESSGASAALQTSRIQRHAADFVWGSRRILQTTSLCHPCASRSRLARLSSNLMQCVWGFMMALCNAYDGCILCSTYALHCVFPCSVQRIHSRTAQANALPLCLNMWGNLQAQKTKSGWVRGQSGLKSLKLSKGAKLGNGLIVRFKVHMWCMKLDHVWSHVGSCCTETLSIHFKCWFFCLHLRNCLLGFKLWSCNNSPLAWPICPFRTPKHASMDYWC